MGGRSRSGDTSRGWLKPQPRRRRPSGRPWRPAALPADADPRKLSYVVIEERVGDALGVLVSPWPAVDAEGRLRFDLDAVVEVGAGVDDLQRELDRRRPPAGTARPMARAIRTRPVELGDVFAATVDADALVVAVDSAQAPAVRSWLGDPIYDVTADAREAARDAFYIALTPRLSTRAKREIRRTLPDADAGRDG